MKKKKGFVFVETICVIVVMLSSLLLLYSSFNKVITREQRYLYYDDISYVYKAETLKRIIYDASTFTEGAAKENSFQYVEELPTNGSYLHVFNSESKYTDISDPNNPVDYVLFPNGREAIKEAFDYYHVYQAFYIEISKIGEIKKEINNNFTSVDLNNEDKNIIDSIIDAFTFDKNKDFFTTYLKKLDVPENKHQGILLFVFYESKNGENGEKESLRSYKECFDNPTNPGTNYTEKTMYCEATPYIAWVYYD